MADLTQDLIKQVVDACETGRSLTVVGGNTKAFYGRESQSDTTIDVAGHQGIVNYEPVELVLTARAGTALTEIQKTLAEHGQMLAFDPPHFQSGATIGGTLATNLSGPCRPWAGSVRDAVLGIRLINGRGEHLRFGGQVMKNVAGYDVSRAQAGALGTLGLITEISLKVMPRPAAMVTLVQECDAEGAIVKMNQLAGTPRPLSAASWSQGKLYLQLSGLKAAVEATVKQWGGERLLHAEDFWASLRDHRLPIFNTNGSLWRFSLKSTAPHWRHKEDWLIDWGGAQRWLRADCDHAVLEQEASAAGGQVILFRGGDRAGEVFATQSVALKKLHKRLKQAFDPRGVFNPGRLYSWM